MVFIRIQDLKITVFFQPSCHLQVTRHCRTDIDKKNHETEQKVAENSIFYIWTIYLANWDWTKLNNTIHSKYKMPAICTDSISGTSLAFSKSQVQSLRSYTGSGLRHLENQCQLQIQLLTIKVGESKNAKSQIMFLKYLGSRLTLKFLFLPSTIFR